LVVNHLTSRKKPLECCLDVDSHRTRGFDWGLFAKLLTGEDGVMAMAAINDDMFTEDVIADPYTYYGRLREEDPVHWNDKYALWVLTRHDDVVGRTRHHEPVSNSVVSSDARPAYPDINESDAGSYEHASDYKTDR